MNKKILLTSLMSIAMLSSIAAGATYALFTAEDSTNIAVTAGRVQVKSNIAGITHYTNGEKQVDGWVNGGKATQENGAVTIDRITPGDSVDIAIEVVNSSNVATRYRTLVEVAADNGLADGLEITLISSKGTESKFTGFAYQDWALLEEEGVAETITIRIALPLEAGNEYQDKSTSINFFVEAVQANASFVNTNGGLAVGENGEVLVSSATDLKIFRSNVNNNKDINGYLNKTIKLTNDIDLGNAYWTPIGNGANPFKGTFDGGEHTISNFNVEAYNNAGLFGYALGGGNIKNLKVEDAVIKSNDYAGAIIGRGYTDIDNCHVKDVTVIATPYLKDGSYDGGAKAGGIIGQILEGDNRVTNCSATDVEIYAFRDLGGVVGMVHSGNTVTGNTATNVTLGYLLNEKITADVNENAGAIYGRISSSAKEAVPAIDSAENKDFNLVYAVYDENSLRTFANNVNVNKVDYQNKTVVMLNDIDLNNSDWEPIGQTGRTEFKGVFDGRKHTIFNLNVDSYAQTGAHYSSGLFGWIEGHGSAPIVVKNLTINNAVVKGNHNCGVVVGFVTENALVENVHVINAVVDGKLCNDDANGDKVGAIIGNLNSNEKTKLAKSSATNCVITAGRDSGQLVGAGALANVVDCEATNVTVSFNGTGTGANIRNELVGRVLG